MTFQVTALEKKFLAETNYLSMVFTLHKIKMLKQQMHLRAQTGREVE